MKYGLYLLLFAAIIWIINLFGEKQPAVTDVMPVGVIFSSISSSERSALETGLEAARYELNRKRLYPRDIALSYEAAWAEGEVQEAYKRLTEIDKAKTVLLVSSVRSIELERAAARDKIVLISLLPNASGYFRDDSYAFSVGLATSTLPAAPQERFGELRAAEQGAAAQAFDLLDALSRSWRTCVSTVCAADTLATLRFEGLSGVVEFR
jgi:hypothetical protein